MGRKLGRPKVGQEVLTRDHILAVALRLVDEQGIDALSMRRLAQALGVDPMAIYHHLPDKRAVLAGVTALVFEELRVPAAGSATWQDEVRAFARAYRALVRAHPNLVVHLVGDLEAVSTAVLEANERLYAALERAGLPAPLVAQAADLVVDYLHGYALAEGLGLQGEPEELQDLADALEQYPAELFPVQRRIFGSLAEGEAETDFEGGLDIIFAGIESIARRTG